MKKFLISALAAAALFGTANAADFEVSETSKVAFSVKHLKLITVDGSFDKFSGKISYDAGKLSALEGSVDVASINTQNGKVNFVEFIGVTDNELKAIQKKQITVKELYKKIGSDVTSYNRNSVI